jgi:hypothetical protein
VINNPKQLPIGNNIVVTVHLSPLNPGPSKQTDGGRIPLL